LLTGIKILVAEDNVLNQKIVSHSLTKNGAAVTIAVNGNEVIRAMENGRFDLILMDLFMPEMDGFEATTYIRQTLRDNIPIIALSASNFEEEMKKCTDTGMNACIVKPFEIKKLEKTITEMGLLNQMQH
jgi:CheY-like chemotaxis protein